MKKPLISFLALCAFLSASHGQLIVLSDDFETPDVTAAQSDGNTSGAFNSANWVQASDGFGAGRQGTVDEAHGDFTDPAGEQAYAFRYTNSGLTSVFGLIGTLDSLIATYGAGQTIDVSFDVVIDGHNDTTPFAVGLMLFADENTVRSDMNSGPLAADGSDGATGLLASVSGDALALGEPGYLSYQSYSFSYTLGDTDIEAGTYNSAHDVGLRIAGATSSAIIDNVVVAVPEPGTFGLIAGCLALTSVMLRRRLG